MYTSVAEIQRKQALADALSGRRGPDPTTGSGLAYALDRYMGGKAGYDAAQAAAENDRLRQQEMSRLATVMSGGAAAPLKPGVMPKFSHPEVQNLAMAHAMQTAEAEQKAAAEAAQATGEFGVSPIYVQNEDGGYGIGQMNKAGGFQMVDMPPGYSPVPDSGRMSYDPNLIATRGAADTAVDVENIQQTASPAAEAAALQEQAVGEVRNEQELAQNQALFEQEFAQNLEEQRRSAFSRMKDKEGQFQMLDSKINEALGQSSGWTTGMAGAMLRGIPGTPAYDLQANLKTIQANAGFDKLQSMRDLSPTGGALGQVSERELELLTSAWSNVDNAQSQEQFESNLRNFQQQVRDSWQRVADAYERDFGQPYWNQTAPEMGADGQPMTELPGLNQDVLSEADRIIGL